MTKGKWLLSLFPALILALMVICLGIAACDGAAWARTGEFRLLPALNVMRFQSDGSLDAEDARALTGASAFLDELYETGRDGRDPLWKFINISTWLALLELPLFYLLWLFGVRLCRGVKVMLVLSGAAALLLIAAARLCARNCYGGFIVEACYPAAYIEGDMLRLLALALLALTLIARACRKE